MDQAQQSAPRQPRVHASYQTHQPGKQVTAHAATPAPPATDASFAVPPLPQQLQPPYAHQPQQAYHQQPQQLQQAYHQQPQQLQQPYERHLQRPPHAQHTHSAATAATTAADDQLAQQPVSTAVPQQPQPQTVDLVDPKEGALSMLRGLGVSAELAAEAVDATEDVFVTTDAAAWADAAQLWLAEEQEHRAERDKLAVAMASSLEEEEARKQTAVPLAEQTEEELRKRFLRSIVLPQVEGTAFAGTLFSPPLRTHLVSLLELERQCCCLWYPGPGTRQYFTDLASECTAAAASEPTAGGTAAASDAKSKRKSPPAAGGLTAKRQASGGLGGGGRGRGTASRPSAAAAAAMARAAATAAGSSPAGGAQPASPAAAAAAAAATADGSTPAASRADPAMAAAWAACLAAKVRFLREQLAWLPQTPGELPPFLVPYADAAAATGGGGAADDDDEIVITS